LIAILFRLNSVETPIAALHAQRFIPCQGRERRTAFCSARRAAKISLGLVRALTPLAVAPDDAA
jgi:hypothetical protein